jgi:hypothetical protein
MTFSQREAQWTRLRSTTTLCCSWYALLLTSAFVPFELVPSLRYTPQPGLGLG